MQRPDPTQVNRRPMARAEGKIVLSGPRRPRNEGLQLFKESHLDLDTLHRVIEHADVVSEGRVESIQGTQRFFGSSILTLDMAHLTMTEPVDEAMTAQFATALTSDPRAQRVLDARVFRELARLLGAETSVDFESQSRTVHSGTTIRIVADFESSIRGAEALAR